MCGLVGFVDRSGRRAEELGVHIDSMTQTLVHRGPDDGGTWIEEESGVGLGSRRLAIIDLSEQGHQPMASADGRFVIAYNGELYNHRKLRALLEASGHRFRGHSDTEVLLASVAEWGLKEALERFVGMFAFALWDRSDRTLVLARDRMGEKPLYYGWAGGVFLFGSELKALRAHPRFSAALDLDAIALFFRHKYIPAPWSVYVGIRKLEPGTFVTLDGSASDLPDPVPYWDWREAVADSMGNPFTGSPQDAVDRLEELLSESVRDRLVADVPVGALLSGGIDSSAVVSTMQQQASSSVRTFTVGFSDHALDESVHAKRVAAHLGTDHTELIVSSSDTMGVIPDLPQIYDEPFADSSQIPTYLISRLAHQHVTVALSGDGGDELFGGYNRYTWVPAIWRSVGWIPRPARGAMAGLLASINPAHWEGILRRLRPVLPPRLHHRLPAEKVAKLAASLPASSPEEMYRRLVTHWEPASIVPAAREHLTIVTDPTRWPPNGDIRHRMMVLDAVTYLPDDILAKVDRASMATSLEVRVPLLDPGIVSFAWSLPPSMKISDGRGKQPLRGLLGRRLPQELLNGPKMGFGIPLGDWLRGPLRDWAEDLLDAKRLRNEGIIHEPSVRSAWNEHLSGRRNRQYELWDVLMLEAWLGSQLDPAHRPNTALRPPAGVRP
jgi:asparagine synthase (glutamine-hydrolysing)